MNKGMKAERAARAFEMAKQWSDYLSFFIRSFFFMSLFFLSLFKARELYLEGSYSDSAIAIEVYVLLCGALSFLVFGVSMLMRIVQFTLEYLMSFVGLRANLWLVLAVSTIVVAVQGIMITSILMTFLGLGVLEAWL